MKTCFLVGRVAMIVAAFAAWTFDSLAKAQEADDKIRVARLIDELGSDSFARRIAADDELARLGAISREALEAASSNPDAEIRLRAKDLLRRLKVEELWLPGKVTFDFRGTPVSEAMAELTRQTGNRLLAGEPFGTFDDVPLHASGTDCDFWRALDEICVESGNRVRAHYDTRNPGLVVVTGPPGKNPVAYAGPIRCQVASARRMFSEELRYDDLDSDVTHTFQIDVQMLWEDRFRLVAYRSQPELIHAVASDGSELAATQPGSGGWSVAHAGTRQVSMSVRMHPPATDAGALSELVLKWGLIAVGDMATLDVTDLTSRQSLFQDDVELIVDSVETGPGPRCEIALVIVRDLITPDPQDVVFQENEFELVDTLGRAYRKQGQTNSLTERGAQIKLTFMSDSTDSQPGVLRLTYPRIRARRDVEIVFHDVPLPAAHPD